MHCRRSLAGDEMDKSRWVEAMVCGEAARAHLAPPTVPLHGGDGGEVRPDSRDSSLNWSKKCVTCAQACMQGRGGFSIGIVTIILRAFIESFFCVYLKVYDCTRISFIQYSDMKSVIRALHCLRIGIYKLPTSLGSAILLYNALNFRVTLI